MSRIRIKLPYNFKVDKRILCTLNHFHFKYINLILEGESDHFIEQHYTDWLSGYFKKIVKYYSDYIYSENRIENKKINSTIQESPELDILTDRFESELISLLNLSVNENRDKKFGIALTHDVDCIKNYYNQNIKSAGVFLINFIKNIGNPEISRFYLKYFFRFISGNVDYNGFSDIVSISRKHSFKPVFFFFSKSGDNRLNLLEELYKLNPDYSLEELRETIDLIAESGIEIGLHGSYKSYSDLNLLKEEKGKLEKIIKTPCLSIRQHFLNFRGNTTTRNYADAGIRFESNCGFVKDNGYYCGTVRPFYSYISEDSQSSVITIPMIFMDAVPLYFKPKTVFEVCEELKEKVNIVKKYNGFSAFNFHQRIISAIPEYRELYESIITCIEKSDGMILPFSKINDLYEIN